MGLTINLNTAVGGTGGDLNDRSETPTDLTRFSIGTKFVNPVDGGLAVSRQMPAALQRVVETSATVTRLTSFLQTQDGVLKYAGTVLERIAALKAAGERAGAQAEFAVCRAELTSAAACGFSGVALFGGFTFTIQTSLVALPSIVISQSNLAPAIGAIIAASDLCELKTSVIQRAVFAVAALRAQNGAEAERLKYAGAVLAVNQANLEAVTSQPADRQIIADPHARPAQRPARALEQERPSPSIG